MVVFLADRANIQTRKLHRRIKNRFQSDGYFERVQFRIAETREPGPYRVVATIDPQLLLDDEMCAVETARIEVGFELSSGGSHHRYWINWIEPDRDFLLGWHQDDDHPDLGPVHVQVSQGGEPVAHAVATFVDAHPMAVLEARLQQVTESLSLVEWQGDAVVGIGW